VLPCSMWPPKGFGVGILAKNDVESALTLRVQFLFFDGCPHAGAAQAALECALQSCGLQTDHYDLVNILDPATPESLVSWGSPTILVNGNDVSGHVQGDGVRCRLYDTSDQVPSVETIAAAIRNGLLV